MNFDPSNPLHIFAAAMIALAAVVVVGVLIAPFVNKPEDKE